MHQYPELVLARNDILAQSELYRPTVFWDEASSQIVSEIREVGVEHFRSSPTALGFFVPTYGAPGGGFAAEQTKDLNDWLASTSPLEKKPQLALQQFLSGHVSAQSYYCETISLPIYQCLSNDQEDSVIATLRSALSL